MGYTNIDDPRFTQTVTLADAYRILEEFVVQYNERGESSTVNLMTDVGLGPRGESCDPAQLDDFLECARKVIAARPDRGR